MILKYLPHSGFDGYQFWSLPIILSKRVEGLCCFWGLGTLVHVGPKIFGGLRPLYRGFKALCRNSCYRPPHRIRVSSGPLDVLIGAYPYWAWEVCGWWWMLSFSILTSENFGRYQDLNKIFWRIKSICHYDQLSSPDIPFTSRLMDFHRKFFTQKYMFTNQHFYMSLSAMPGYVKKCMSIC